MKKISKSPKRNTFQVEGHIKRAKEKGEDPDPAYLEMWENFRKIDAKREVDPKWQKNNLEYDLRSTDWICDKVKNNDNYAQNLYAAMCNIQWCNVTNTDKESTLNILKGNYWSCSWRHSGGIIADMREQGDYIDWYCSGIGNQDTGYGLTDKNPELDKDGRTFVPEGVVTEEIRADLKCLGWVSVDWDEDNS
jgi:hypothetical protein